MFNDTEFPCKHVAAAEAEADKRKRKEFVQKLLAENSQKQNVVNDVNENSTQAGSSELPSVGQIVAVDPLSTIA